MRARLVVFTLAAGMLVAVPARAGDPLAGSLTVVPRSGLQFRLGDNEKTLSGSYDGHLGLKSRVFIEGEVPISSDREALLFEGGGVPSGFRFTLRIGQDKYWTQVGAALRSARPARAAVCEAAAGVEFCPEALIEAFCSGVSKPEPCAAYEEAAHGLTHAVLDRNAVDQLIDETCRQATPGGEGCTTTQALKWAKGHGDSRLARVVEEERAALDKILAELEPLPAERRRSLSPRGVSGLGTVFNDWGAELGAKYDRVSAVVGDVAGASEDLSSYQLTAGVHLMATWTNGLAFTARAGVERSQGVKADSLELCRVLAPDDDGNAGTSCKTVKFVPARPSADTSAYVRTALTLVGAGNTGEPTGEIRANLENLGHGTTLDLQLRLFLTPAGQAAGKGKGTMAGRLGIGFQASYALQDGPGGSYQAHTWRQARPFGFVALTF